MVAPSDQRGEQRRKWVGPANRLTVAAAAIALRMSARAPQSSWPQSSASLASSAPKKSSSLSDAMRARPEGVPRRSASRVSSSSARCARAAAQGTQGPLPRPAVELMAGLDDDDKRRRTCPLYTTLMAVFLLVAGTVSLLAAVPRIERRPARGAVLRWATELPLVLNCARPCAVLCRALQVLLGIGIPELAQGTDRSISMVVLGSLCFIPGSYASWILLGACQRWRNYRYDQLPSYDD